MLKISNIFFLILILIFYLNVYKFYSSNKNINIKDFTRNNIHQIINDKISDLPVLPNDTNNIIEFNDSFSNEINTTKPRSFWNLLKSK
jgi:hypothetical protein